MGPFLYVLVELAIVSIAMIFLTLRADNYRFSIKSLLLIAAIVAGLAATFGLVLRSGLA
jgi:uncharacterized membrane protein